jgi:hypothetical protein
MSKKTEATELPESFGSENTPVLEKIGELLDAVKELTKEVGKLWKSHNDLIEELQLKKKAGKF